MTFIPVALWFRQQITEDGSAICTLVFPKSNIIAISVLFTIPFILVGCLLPMGVLVYNYQQIFKKIISTKSTWAASCVVVSTIDVKGCSRSQIRRQSELSLTEILTPWPRKVSSASQFNSNYPARHGSMSHHEEIRLNKHVKVVRTLFLNVILVLVMWLPITVMPLLIFFDGRRPIDDKNYYLRSCHFIIALSIAYLNTLINPILYGILSDNFKSCLKRIWCQQNDIDSVNIVKENITPSSGRNAGPRRMSKKQNFIDSVSESPNELV